MNYWLIFAHIFWVLVTHANNCPSLRRTFDNLVQKNDLHKSKRLKFGKTINHPKYLLWDNFGFIDNDGLIHIYSMSAPKNLTEQQRHHQAHWRHFISKDRGFSFEDLGPSLVPEQVPGGAKSIWSGTVVPTPNGKTAAFFTWLAPGTEMKQTIGIALSDDAHHFEVIDDSVLDHTKNPKRWKDKGYFVDDPKTLGNMMGEPDGSIQALRDPYPLFTKDGKIHIFFAAKKNVKGKPPVSAIGHAIIDDLKNPSDTLRLQSPITPPDMHKYNQIELPNVIQTGDDEFAWIVSTKTRMSEEQLEIETLPSVRMYRSKGLRGELESIHDGPVLEGSRDGVYGFTYLQGSLNDGKVKGRLFQVGDKGIPFTLPETIELDLQ